VERLKSSKLDAGTATVKNKAIRKRWLLAY
jgi:hypothetical protein